MMMVTTIVTMMVTMTETMMVTMTAACIDYIDTDTDISRRSVFV